ncbi:hypothetical protein PILCRDRAFT_818279 [Piloderma croceum F 1598]|uniref:Uncharacterized protein n=1 Tax=Piloderma croceum (strain F 1598) TaxID=765440 RepID=A0A0C3G266_PILCF|nr:hypothetical protein PILCRDRAFT_818279 [Piloderma croceum F 1598]
MPPKPRAARKASIAKEASKTTVKQEKDVPKSSTKDAEMPPPPDPLPPAGILEPEINALSGCLKNAVVKTGQVYAFYADTRRLGIQKYAPYPPPELTASLGREVEKFDQLFDAVEAQLLRAITVLQRDLGRERKRLQDTEKAAVASRTRSKSLSRSPTSMKVPLPGPSSDAAPDSLANDQGSTQMSPPPTSGGSGTSSGPSGRRSTISLSSLHRPVFPHKLDLSSTTLRLTAEDASMFSSGPLASPVTLAPKSARPSTTEIDFMAVFETRDPNNRPVDIDLTLPDTEPPDGNTSSDVNMNVDASLGNSADKPIELDLDINMSDLFGDTADDGSTDPNASLFSPVAGSHELSSAAGQDQKSVKRENMGMEILDVLSAVGDADRHNDLFASFQNNRQPSGQSQLQSNTTSEGLSAPLGPSSSGNGSAPSPASILASFAAPQMNTNDHPTSPDAHNLPGGDASFDISSIDLAKVFSGEPGSVAEIEELLNSGGFGPTT